eukprot:1328360-Pleurochrysis_carterae.AAC.1
MGSANTILRDLGSLFKGLKHNLGCKLRNAKSTSWAHQKRKLGKGQVATGWVGTECERGARWVPACGARAGCGRAARSTWASGGIRAGSNQRSHHRAAT